MLTGTALIVEDQAITALDLKNIIKSCGYSNSIIFSSGKKAINFIENEIVSFALLDIKLADDTTGIEIAHKLKQLKIPFIFISAFSDPHNLKRAKELEPNGIVTKPLDEKYLINLIQNFNKTVQT